MPLSRLSAYFLICVVGASSAAAQEQDVLLSAMKAELARSYKGLEHAEKVPIYYLGYEARDTRTYDLLAVLGAVQSENERHVRALDVDTRVGNRHFDNTHQIKGGEMGPESSGEVRTELTVDDDEAALRADLWLAMDRDYKAALSRYEKVETNKAVTAAEEDPSDDFSEEKPVVHYDKVDFPNIEKNLWRERLKRLSLSFKQYPFVFGSLAALSARSENRYMVNTEGTSIVTGNRYVRLSYQIGTRTEDGMDLQRTKSYDSDRLEDLPSEEAVLADMRRSVEELKSLRSAPLVEPYTGPAIIRNRAAGVYFHEILGHRLEGHRQKIEEEGQTFTKKLGTRIVAPFISVHDDPTLERFGKQFLRGFYRFDDEGVSSQRAALIENGVLKSFLMARSPIRHFPHSNGHGRRSAGYDVVARMGNTIVSATKAVPYPQLRQMLIAQIKKQKKPYGLVFEDIEGGFTGTSRFGPQSFKVIPLLVYRVYPDGRPDEAVRGVDIVGTPLTSFSRILAAANDSDVFNGTCGAESGWVPVSAVAPSLLISEIEVEKKVKSSEKPPILPPPYQDPAGGAP